MSMHLFALSRQSPMPVVLTDNFVSRLSAVNSAVRRIKKLGYRIAWQNLNQDSDMRPEVFVEVGRTRTDQPLIKLGNGFGMRRDNTKRYAYTVFEGVTVCWEGWS